MSYRLTGVLAFPAPAWGQQRGAACQQSLPWSRQRESPAAVFRGRRDGREAGGSRGQRCAAGSAWVGARGIVDSGLASAPCRRGPTGFGSEGGCGRMWPPCATGSGFHREAGAGGKAGGFPTPRAPRSARDPDLEVTEAPLWNHVRHGYRRRPQHTRVREPPAGVFGDNRRVTGCSRLLSSGPPHRSSKRHRASNEAPGGVPRGRSAACGICFLPRAVVSQTTLESIGASVSWSRVCV